MVNIKSFDKFNIAKLIAVLSQYTELDSMLHSHFRTFMKAHLQLLFINHDGILNTDLVIHRSGNGLSKAELPLEEKFEKKVDIRKYPKARE